MIPAVMLDTGPLGLLTQRQGVPEADKCKGWLASLTSAGVRILVPEIADYELRRELLRSRKSTGLMRLDAFIHALGSDYLPITTAAMRQAAEYWAYARQQGVPTAPDLALDADVILAAQAWEAGVTMGDIVVATTNVRHLKRFVVAQMWQEIQL